MPWVKIESAREVLQGTDDVVGAFEQILGFRTSTHAIKGVHIMNDCAQTLLGGAPGNGGDFLCRVIRVDKDDEPNSEDQMRADELFGRHFNAAFPRELGPRRIRALRQAAATVLNYDGGMYRAGDRMASALATHQGLLGFEGFRRFRIGRYLTRILSTSGQQRLRELLTSDRDPMTRALRPLIVRDPLVDPSSGTAASTPPPLTPFDTALGARLSKLLAQPLTKPALLRAFSLGASVGLVLKILGVGREGGRPTVLALASDENTLPSRPLREEAVQSFQRARDSLDTALAAYVTAQGTSKLYSRATEPSDAVEISGGQKAALELITKLRAYPGETKIYWPDEFAVALGRKAGCILPRTSRAGWGAHLALAPEHVEVLTLMSVPPDSERVPWSRLWNDLRADLGLIVGVNPVADADALRSIGVMHVSAQKLRDNAAAILRGGVLRGAAHRLPDGGAEAVGTLA